MKKTGKKQILPICMAALMTVTSVSPALAAAPASAKEEVIYVTLGADGAPKSAYVVNSFAGGEITDYGDYTSVKMLNVNDPIKQDGDTITISSAAEKVYYQGELAEAEIPWNVSLRYYLDGNEYTAEELAGKSGELKIKFQITENTDCPGTFFDDYALQASVSLDTNQCRNITAADSTIANVGSTKQLSYTILPGKGLDTEITADVTDFEMSSISINGIHLNLNVEIDDAELKDKVDELIDAVAELDDGAVKLSDGSGELLDGSSSLVGGASSLHSGSTALDQGVASLQSGLRTVQKGLSTLDSQSSTLTDGSSEFKEALGTLQTAVDSFSASEEDLTELVTSSGQIKQALSDLSTGAATLQANLGYAQYKALMAQNGLNIDDLTAGNLSAISTINGYEALLEQLGKNPAYKETVDQYKPALLQAAGQITTLLGANNAAISGMESYLNGVTGELPTLTGGLAELSTQYETFDTAISTLVTSLGTMTGSLSELADGINQLVTAYEELDTGIGSYTDGVAQLAAGYSQIMTGVSSLAKGSKELVSGTGKLYDGTAALYDGVVTLCDGAAEMSEGTGEFRTETSDMDEQIDEQIDSILETIGGSMEDPVSFVSKKNTNVESVQFVIRTDAIETEEVEETEVETEKETSFEQKLKDLFR